MIKIKPRVALIDENNKVIRVLDRPFPRSIVDGGLGGLKITIPKLLVDMGQYSLGDQVWVFLYKYDKLSDKERELFLKKGGEHGATISD